MSCRDACLAWSERRPDPEKLSELVEHLAAGELVRRSVRVADKHVTLSTTGTPAVLELADKIVSQTFGPNYRMLLINTDQLAEYLATITLFNGFTVTVYDPRSEYRVG